MPNRTRLFAGLACCLPLLMPSAEVCAAEPISKRIDEVIEAPRYEESHWGLLVVDLKTEQVVYQKNADKLFAPASTTKLYSVAAALDVLGPDFRFQTPIYRRGNVDKVGSLDGDLILVASGDLSMGGRTDARGHIAFTLSDHTYANGNVDLRQGKRPAVGSRQDPRWPQAVGAGL